MQSTLFIILIIILLLYGLCYLIKGIITSAAKEGTLQALKEYDNLKKNTRINK